MIFVLTSGCNSHFVSIKEVDQGYEIGKRTDLAVVLQMNLSSNINNRGDIFITYLKEPLVWKGKTILKKDTQINGLIKRATKYEKFGDRANLVLLFDQIVLADDRKIPFLAILNTDKGQNSIKIQGKGMKEAKMIGGTAILGALIGSADPKAKEHDSAKKGLLVGAALGTGSVLLSNMKEIHLPEGTEFIIKLEEKLFIPK